MSWPAATKPFQSLIIQKWLLEFQQWYLAIYSIKQMAKHFIQADINIIIKSWQSRLYPIFPFPLIYTMCGLRLFTLNSMKWLYDCVSIERKMQNQRSALFKNEIICLANRFLQNLRLLMIKWVWTSSRTMTGNENLQFFWWPAPSPLWPSTITIQTAIYPNFSQK